MSLEMKMENENTVSVLLKEVFNFFFKFLTKMPPEPTLKNTTFCCITYHSRNLINLLQTKHWRTAGFESNLTEDFRVINH